MPTIRIDEEVYVWLQSQAVPLEDTPNTVLRRIARLDIPKKEKVESDDQLNSQRRGGTEEMATKSLHQRDTSRLNGKKLSKRWNVDVRHKLYHRDGTFYENLSDFPGALFDPNGYIVFKSEQEYINCTYLNIGQKLNVSQGISSIPGYKRMV